MRLLDYGLLAAASLLLAACGGAAAPTLTPRPTAPPTVTPLPDRGYPAQPPDMAQGAALFAARCTPCHGERGLANGPLVRANALPAPPPMLAAFETARDQTPLVWFQFITTGRIESMMPPWRDALAEDDRWAVALFTYTLPYTPDQLARGCAVWKARCAECHAAPPDLADPRRLITRSDQDLYDALASDSGLPEHTFTDPLAEADRWAVTFYTRSLGLAGADAIGRPLLVESAPPTPAPDTGQLLTITGRITNGTAGGSVPPNARVTLVIQTPQQAQQRETTASADGVFQFTDVPRLPNADYMAAIAYRDRAFSSPPAKADGAPALDLPLTIYELTEDPTVLAITGVTARITAIGRQMEVQQTFIVHNTSDRAYTTSQAAGDNRFLGVVVSLPPGAQPLGFDSPARYVVDEARFAVADTLPVLPGRDHALTLSYLLPYDAAGAVIEQPLHYRFDGQLRLLTWPDSLRLSSQQVTAAGADQVDGRGYRVFAGALSLPEGEALRYELAGAGAPAAALLQAGETGDAGGSALLLVVIAAGLAGAAGLALLRLRPGRQARIDALARQIQTLDAQHRAGQINHDLWHRRRGALQAQLTALLGKDDGDDED